MKVSSVLLSASLWAVTVSGFGARGCAERALYYSMYISEEILAEGDMKFATGCVGSRTGIGGQARRCYLSEFLTWIDSKQIKNLNYDKVNIGGASTESGRATGNWHNQENILKNDNAKNRVKDIRDMILHANLAGFKSYNPPPDGMDRRSKEWTGWRAANPDWKEGMPKGEGHTKAFVPLKNGKPIATTEALKAKPFQDFLNYQHIDGIERDHSPAKYQEFIHTLSDHQQRINTAFERSSNEVKGKFKSWMQSITMATDMIIEMRKQDHFKNVIYGAKKFANRPHLERSFGTDLRLDKIQGTFEKFEVPKKTETIEAAVLSNRFESREAAEAAFDKISRTEESVKHLDVIQTMKNLRARYTGSEAISHGTCK
ncbi:hypothetical protein DCS_08171 [Drechmeria coniospora]|uniref:Uncharacterized protein n=1 Tax=Drechmeria coniospora TaxID=98403 RepID=A0A151GGH2_DRECN|nr:hypothetical protein DCS_08171 [Drechmeria coniospora]KYK56203.1 hypothetical protein DCS_08171 [Drechmeria coniospora]